MENNNHTIIYFNILANFLVFLFALYMGITIILNKYESNLLKGISFVIIVLVIYLASKRTTYLPFLGYAAIPKSVIIDSKYPTDANIELNLPFKYKDGTKIIYWGAKPASQTVSNPTQAYDDYSNAGVTSVLNGSGLIKFNCPAKYVVPWGKTLDRHLHYRVVNTEGGMIGPVQTLYVKC